jgi:protocatechuate 3,4-dioxygenase beta subunit
MNSQLNLISRICQIAILLFVSSTVASAQTSDSKSKPNGSISGRVTIDGNGAAGIPVAAVEGQSVNRRDAPARAVSDLEGNYRISGLAPGEYQVWTLTPALIMESTPNFFRYAGAAKSILLSAGESVTDVDLKLMRGAVITGRVTDSDNKPVVQEHMKLQLLDAKGNPRFGSFGSTYDQMYQTDDRGVYRIFDLPPGRYRVSVGYDSTQDGIIRGRRYQQTSYLDPGDQSKPGIVELGEGDEAREIDIRVGSAPESYAVSGRVIDRETGVPIPKAGARFAITQKDQNQSMPGFIIQTDERGEFTFGGLAPGHYAVTASSEYYSGNFYGDPVYFDITDKDVKDLELKTVPGLSVGGYITADGLSTQELMGLLPNLMIVASEVSTVNSQLRTGGRAMVAPDGSFEIDGLRPGPVSLFVSAQRPTFIRTNINRMEREGVPVSQNFQLKESTSDLHVVIDYGTGTIRGNVRFEGDPAITDSMMVVKWKRKGASDGNFAQVDARGHFLITNLPPGQTEVSLQINSLTPRPPRGIPPQTQTVNVTNGAETEVTFVFDLASPGGP